MLESIVSIPQRPSARFLPIVCTMLAAILVVAPIKVVADGGASARAVPSAFEICAACHTTSKQTVHGIGPNLRGIVGRKAGKAGGFNYSAAMKRSAIVWTPKTLDGFLAQPMKAIPNNSMAYSGLASAKDRAEVIKYIQTLR